MMNGQKSFFFTIVSLTIGVVNVTMGRFNNILDYGKKMTLMDVPKFLKIKESNKGATYINLKDIIQIDEVLDEDEYLFHTSRGTYHRVPINEGTSKIVEYLLNQLL